MFSDQLKVHKFIISFTLMFFLTACATDQEREYSGYLNDYSRLGRPTADHPILKDDEDAKIFVDETVDFKKYDSLIVEPFALTLTPSGTARAYDTEIINKIVNRFEQKFHEYIKETVHIVNKPGPNVMRLRVAIVDIEKTIPALNIHPLMKLSGAGIGGASSEGELLDSTTNKQLAAVINTDKGSKLNLVSGLSAYGNAEEVVDKWAEELAQGLKRIMKSK